MSATSADEGYLNKLTSSNPGNRCKARNSQGQPCGGFALADGDYCWAHDPSVRQKRQQARSQGGKARRHRHLSWSDDEHRPGIHIQSASDILALVERAVLAETVLENSHSRNRTIGYLCAVAAKVLEIGEYEQRLTELEARIAKP
jgi:hypothetical protein